MHHPQALHLSVRIHVYCNQPESVIAGDENLKLPILDSLQNCLPVILPTMTQPNPKRPPGGKLPLPVS